MGMHHKTVRKILDDEETIDIAKTAEAILEEKKHEEERNRVPNTANSIAAYRRLKEAEQEKEKFRQQLAKVWNKRKKA